MYKSSLIFLLLFFVGCGLKQSSTQYRDSGYIKIYKSNSTEYTMSIDTDRYKIKDTKDRLYKVDSGTKEIKVYDENSKLIYNAKKYIGSNSTLEIDLR